MGETRLKKAWCESCGYTIRVTTKWIMLRVPICPICKKNMRHELEHLEGPLPNQLDIFEGGNGSKN